ncbi:MAG: MBL fold metallo-hydrolase [Tannerellaceae bacterium]|nr:MBL fold metallo-hydrolase [Tannerellaceae bacterium]
MIHIKPFEFNYFSVNTYLVYDDTKEGVLIDCGCMRREEEKELIDFIEENGIELKHLLCTHLHVDHILGNEFIYQTYGLSPEAHRAEVEALPSAQKQADMLGLPIQVTDIPVKHFIVGNDLIRFGDSELKALLVSGHSPGSLAFYNQQTGFVVVGDTLFERSIGRTDLWGGNQEVLVAAIKDKLLSLPDETIVYPGHGPETRVVNEILSNPYL